MNPIQDQYHKRKGTNSDEMRKRLVRPRAAPRAPPHARTLQPKLGRARRRYHELTTHTGRLRTPTRPGPREYSRAATHFSQPRSSQREKPSEAGASACSRAIAGEGGIMDGLSVAVSSCIVHVYTRRPGGAARVGGEGARGTRNGGRVNVRRWNSKNPRGERPWCYCRQCLEIRVLNG